LSRIIIVGTCVHFFQMWGGCWNSMDEDADFFGDVLEGKNADLLYQLSPNPDDLADDLDVSCSEV